MTLALAHSRARTGVHAPAVRVEVYLAAGLPALNIVGLPEAAVRESRDRVRAAIQCAQFEFPSRRITVNLAPADLPKDGGRFDLPIALGILAANGDVDVQALGRFEFLGELALTGELRAIDGVLPAALAAARAGRALIVPAGPTVAAMSIRRSTPVRGLIAGLVAFVVFASSAVGMTTGASFSGIVGLPQTLTAQVLVHHDDRHGAERGDGGGGHHR